jgi:hypothetical protein
MNISKTNSCARENNYEDAQDPTFEPPLSNIFSIELGKTPDTVFTVTYQYSYRLLQSPFHPSSHHGALQGGNKESSYPDSSHAGWRRNRQPGRTF